MTVSPHRQRGFSLLEAVIAFAITAMALVALYQTTAGALQRVGEAEAYSYALLMAESLLARYEELPAEGVAQQGETEDGYRWTLRSQPLAAQQNAEVVAPFPLHEVRATVAWQRGFREREVVLVTIRPGRSR